MLVRISFAEDTIWMEGWSLEAWEALATTPAYRRVAWNTLWFVGLATGVSVALGVAVAHALEKYDLPAERVVVAAVSFPIALPGIVVAYLITVLLGNQGVVTNAIATVTGASAFDLASATAITGLFLGYVYSLLPRATMVLRGTYAEVNAQAEEAARTLGASRWETFYHVTLPEIRPGIAAAAILTFRSGLAIFGTVLILQSHKVITLQIHNEISVGSYAPPTWRPRSGSSTWSLSSRSRSSGCGSSTTTRWRSEMTGDASPRADGGSTATGNSDAASTTRPDGGSVTASQNRRWSRSGRALSTLLGRPIVAGVVAVVTAFLTIPVLVAFVSSFAESGSGVLPTGFVTFDHWRKVLGFGDYGVRQNAIPGLTYSLLIATGGMVLNVLIGVPIAYALARYDFYARDWINTFAILPLVPGLILGIAFIQTYPEHGRSSLTARRLLSAQIALHGVDRPELVPIDGSGPARGERPIARGLVAPNRPHRHRPSGETRDRRRRDHHLDARGRGVQLHAQGRQRQPDPFAMFLYRNIATNASYLQSAAAVSVYFLIVVAAIVVLQLLGKRGSRPHTNETRYERSTASNRSHTDRPKRARGW